MPCPGSVRMVAGHGGHLDFRAATGKRNTRNGAIVYCRSGTRAALAAATLKELGFENVANLDGGFAAWKDVGLPTVEHHAEM